MNDATDDMAPDMAFRLEDGVLVPLGPRPRDRIREQQLARQVAESVTRCGPVNQPPAANDLAQVGWIKTFTGKFVQPLALTPADIDIRDIAHALSRVCRFGGHCAGVMNVAAHSVRVLNRFMTANPGATIQEKLTALLHDASEAYLGDIPRPLKQHPAFEFYVVAEMRAEAVIADKFGLIYPMPQAVKDADNAELAAELDGQRYEPHDESPSLSEAEFLFWFERLATRERGGA